LVKFSQPFLFMQPANNRFEIGPAEACAAGEPEKKCKCDEEDHWGTFSSLRSREPQDHRTDDHAERQPARPGAGQHFADCV
jgi:hypothetical protein